MAGSTRYLPHPNPEPIPREHWDHWPWNRWTFQNVRQCVPTAEVWRGEGPVWELPEHRLHELRRFFLDYKLLEEKEVDVQEFLGPDKARAVVKQAMRRYEEELLPVLAG